MAKTRDASDRRLPPKRTRVHPHLARSQLSTAAFAAMDTPRSLRLRAVVTGGPGVFTTPETASADRSDQHDSRTLLPHGLEIRAWAFSSHGAAAIEPLTPLSPSSLHPPPHRPSPMLHSWPCVPLLEGFARVGGRDDGLDHGLRLPVKADASE